MHFQNLASCGRLHSKHMAPQPHPYEIKNLVSYASYNMLTQSYFYPSVWVIIPGRITCIYPSHLVQANLQLIHSNKQPNHSSAYIRSVSTVDCAVTTPSILLLLNISKNYLRSKNLFLIVIALLAQILAYALLKSTTQNGHEKPHLKVVCYEICWNHHIGDYNYRTSS